MHSVCVHYSRFMGISRRTSHLSTDIAKLTQVNKSVCKQISGHGTTCSHVHSVEVDMLNILVNKASQCVVHQAIKILFIFHALCRSDIVELYLRRGLHTSVHIYFLERSYLIRYNFSMSHYRQLAAECIIMLNQ